MKALFIELYLDEDVHVLVADLVRSYGFSALTARDADMLGCDDATQLAYAARHDKALLTHNRVDFEQLARAYIQQGTAHAGIIIAVRRSPYAIGRRAARLLDHVTADEMRNQVRYI